jgi:amino acid adenylation domain-containing protein
MPEASALPDGKIAPLSHEQEQLWFLYQLRQTSVDNECWILAMPGQLQPEVLRESLATFVLRHEIWRTTFRAVSGQPVQVVRPASPWAWSEADLSALGGAEQEEALRQAEHATAAEPFALEEGPLVRALLVRLGEREHRLVLTLHNIVSDEVSMTDVFLPELRELYGAAVQGRRPELVEPPPQYADYASWQRGEHRQAEIREGLEFWKKHLAGAPTVLELPADHRRPDQQSGRGGMLAFDLGERLTTRLQELSSQELVTLRTTLTAAFETLLYRYLGQDDFLIGTTVPGRDGAHLRRAVGCFVNTVVLRADFSAEPTVRDMLARVRAATEATADHHDVPFDAVVRAVQPERNLGYQPLVQVLLTFRSRSPSTLDGWELRPCSSGARTARFDLWLEIDDLAASATGRFIYNADLFEPQTIERMASHWRMLLDGMAAEPWQPVAQLQLLTGSERDQLLAWSRGGELSDGPDIDLLIAERARATPDAIAAICEGEELTYGQLNGRANQLARYLRDRGVGPEVPVGVCLERSLDRVICLLAILRAGGADVPVDPESPEQRIQFVVQDTQMPLLLTQERLRHRLGNIGTDVVALDLAWETIGHQSDHQPAWQPAKEQLACIFYTSGSTGQPKGVMTERGVLAAHCRAMIDKYELGPGDRVLQFSQYTADASLEQILPTLAAGGRLIMRGTEIWSPQQLLREVKARQITVMNLWPTYWTQAVRDWSRDPDELTGTQLRLVILGGERLSAAVVQEWRELAPPGVRLLNAYGPTEATITATIGEAGQEQESITIGQPVAGRRTHILDRRGGLVPAGVVGELHIGGPLLARGYLNQPGLTKERFVSDPFEKQEAGRLYRTGDLARYLGNGCIEYVGRADHQVKVRGYRIELGEVEAVLARHPDVGEAVVVAREDHGSQELVAYVVPREQGLLQETLWRYLEQKLPRYMQPTAIQQLAALPKLASGKPDRRRLPDVERGERREESAYAAPRLLGQQQLVQLWEELLEPRPIGIRDNFFHLGGHSLLAAQLVERIEQAYGKKLPLSVLFARPTIEQLAEALQEREEGPRVRAQVLPVQVEGSRRPFFFLHGDWTRGAFYCFTLARACGAAQPFYVLEPYTFNGQAGAPTLEAIAQAHIEAMREVQADGPYRLGGFCNGGLIAYEMARQLERDGEQIEFLALLNPSAPVQFSLLWSACETMGRLRPAGGVRKADLFLRARHAQRHIYRRLRPHGRRVQDFAKLLEIEPRLKTMFPPREALYKDYVGVFSWAGAGYSAGTYRGKATFYWARDEPRVARTWRPIIDRMGPAHVQEHVVAGTHMAAVTDHIQETAELLSESLSSVERESRGPAG